MDYESLIADLQKISQMNSISHYKRDVCAAAAIALSTLQAENEKLLDENRRWSEAMRTLSCAIENLRAELEQVKAERDDAVALAHEWEQYGRYLSPMGFTVPPNWKED